MPSTQTGFDSLIETLKSKPEASETLSLRISGTDVETWNKLKEDHPDMSASELIKEGLRLRHLADVAALADRGLFFRKSTGETVNVLELLGLSRAREKNAEDVHLQVPAKALAATTPKASSKPTTSKQSGSGVDTRAAKSAPIPKKRPHDTVP